MTNIEVIDRAADNIRILIAAMVEQAQSGHPGGAMGGADFINILYSEFLVFDPQNPTWHGRDRFFLDPGHMSPMLYSVLALFSYFSMDELKKFRKWNSSTPGHPELNLRRGIENTSGPLGQGHAYAVGAAIASKFIQAKINRTTSQKIYSYISDGGIQEEVSQGAGRLAGHLGLNNLIVFYDSNDLQLSTRTDVVTSENTENKYLAWGWSVIKINGNNTKEIRNALQKAKKEENCPTLIIGKTIMGKGIVKDDGSPFERNCATHGMPLSECGASFSKTIQNLGGDSKSPFQIFSEVKDLYKKRGETLRKIVDQRLLDDIKWMETNPEMAAKLNAWIKNQSPKIDWNIVQQKSNQSTRSASSIVLGFLARRVENMIVASADLSNSDKTDGFLKQTKAITRNDFSGAFLQVGVSELTMACICIGISLYGGIIPACSTFFVFSDYMKPAIRMAALMELPIKFIWTHDTFRVGEDGPTHEPIEQESQIRLMEKLKNHKGNNSMLILRPADVYETTVSWQLAMENISTPTGLIFSRQNIVDLPTKINRSIDALQVKNGGYIIECDGNNDGSGDDDIDIILLASGSEVSTLVEGAQLLRSREGIKIRIVSIPSEGLFRSQTKKYQDSILLPGKKIFGLTAGLPINLLGLVGSNGKIWGLESFGFSAPYKILDEKFGFTGENVYKQVKQMI